MRVHACSSKVRKWARSRRGGRGGQEALGGGAFPIADALLRAAGGIGVMAADTPRKLVVTRGRLASRRARRNRACVTFPPTMPVWRRLIYLTTRHRVALTTNRLYFKFCRRNAPRSATRGEARRGAMTKRALQGPRHQRRLQHLSARDRGGAAARSARHRGERCRPRIRRVGRGGRRLPCGHPPPPLPPPHN